MIVFMIMDRLSQTHVYGWIIFCSLSPIKFPFERDTFLLVNDRTYTLKPRLCHYNPTKTQVNLYNL